MLRLVWCILILTTCALFVSAMSAKPPARVDNVTDTVTIFLTGNELGAMKPCGCSGGQLGGLEKRGAIFNTVRPSERMIIDTGRLVERSSEQNLIKFNIIIQAFELLGYDIVNLTDCDIETARNLGVLDSLATMFKPISSSSPPDVNLPEKFTKRFSLKGKTITVTVATFNAELLSAGKISELFAPCPDANRFNILILNSCTADVISSIAKTGLVDWLVCPAESDEVDITGQPNERPLVISPGRYGKYVSKLKIRTSPVTDKLEFNFSAIPVTENLPQQPALVELYKVYQQLVKQASLLSKQGRFPLPGASKYVGSKACKLCHGYEYDKWSTKAHAHAYRTLEKEGSQFDPECVICHVVGMEYDSGFISQEKTRHLKNVGCENCHGPGSEHVENEGATPTGEPKSYCVDCHTPDHSSEYADNEKIYFEKIIHWREPKSADNVKSKGGSKKQK